MNQIIILAADPVVPSALDAWGPTLAQLGIAGAVLWYVGNKLIPRLMDANAEQVRAFREEAKSERDQHTAALAAQREHDDKRTSETHARIDGLASEVRSLHSHRAA